MGLVRKIVGLAALYVFFGGPVWAQVAAPELSIETHSPQDASVDYAGFMDLSDEVFAYRETRLISIEAFNAKARTPGTIILDTRSKAAFDEGHIEGAVHLNFSDFTDEKLAAVLGDKATPILIYCNNNFVDDISPFVKKSQPLALNIPTFINLYGYGYKNIYELKDGISLADPRVSIVKTP